MADFWLLASALISFLSLFLAAGCLDSAHLFVAKKRYDSGLLPAIELIK